MIYEDDERGDERDEPDDDDEPKWAEPCGICGPYAPEHEGGPLFHVKRNLADELY